MQKRTVYSLLLTSLLLVCAFSLASAQNAVTFDSPTVARCQANVLDIEVTNAADISAFEIIFEIESTDGGAFFDAVDVSWDPGLLVLTNRIVDLSGVDFASPDTVRIAGMMTDDGDACLAGGATTVAQLEFTTNDVCAGTIALTGADFACPAPSTVTATTQFVDCATTTLVPAVVNAGTVTIENQLPTIDPIADGTVHWGLAYTGQATGDDPDLHTTPGGCEALTFSLYEGPEDMDVYADGSIYWPTGGEDVCYPDRIIIQVADGCGDTDTTSFAICVYNDPPEITCPTDTQHVVWSETVTGSVSGFDPDGGPGALMYSVAGFSGPGTVTIDPVNGDWSWVTLEDNAYIGLHELQIAVSDGANVCPCSPANADTCSVFIYVIPTTRVWIEKTHGTLQGHTEEVSIYLDSNIVPGNEMGGYDFLIKYDASALSFQVAEPGQLLVDCGWEYFTYRYGANGNCGPGACPSGIVRIVAMAETNNGANHPSCFIDDNGQLASLTFMVSDDRTFECMRLPIQWIWYDCGDNGISSVTGDTLFMSREVYGYDSVGLITDLGAEFPTMFGAPAVCDTYDKAEPLRLIDFHNGGIDVVCADSIDARGDLNVNGQGYEIADAVLFTNYFVFGIGVFGDHYEASAAASDVNADGLPLSVGDLVYLVRVIVGDASPYPKVVPTAKVDLVNRSGVLTVTGEDRIGAAFAVVAGSINPTLLADNMEMLYATDNEGNTRIMVWSRTGESFQGEFLQIDGELISLEMATDQGYPVAAKNIPADFSLMQNYPNPFNPTTMIAFGLPTASNYDLVIYNVNGQEVASFSGAAEAGIHTVEWNASDRSSGIYFYRLETDSGFSATKKMVLLK